MSYCCWKCWSILTIGGVPASRTTCTQSGMGMAKTEVKADTVITNTESSGRKSGKAALSLESRDAHFTFSYTGCWIKASQSKSPALQVVPNPCSELSPWIPRLPHIGSITFQAFPKSLIKVKWAAVLLPIPTQRPGVETSGDTAGWVETSCGFSVLETWRWRRWYSLYKDVDRAV